MGCLCCGAGSEVGVLCRGCAQQVAPCEGLIQDHVHSNVTAVDGDAWLVDGFGVAHAVAPKTMIGRNHEDQLVVLAASVSREHAELRQADATWHVRDLGSRNGTYVDGTRVQGRVVLPPRAVLKVGDVALWFLTEVASEPVPPPSMATGSIGGGLVPFLLHHSGIELCLVSGNDTARPGGLLSRAAGAEAWAERALPQLEFQLLRVLCVAAVEEASSPAAVRGCVATKQLARDLPFQAAYPDEENVRQVVRRLRGALSEVGAGGILAVVPGRGYYLACKVTVAGSGKR
ncbi:MAG: domain containing protein [Deltaproteobacteria bacterium]|nr:domain containing protein [Deltaproteobacteria bacterium]